MASTCDFYKNSTIVGSGVCADGSFDVTSYVPYNAGLSGDIDRLSNHRRLTIVITQAGSNAGKSWNTRVVSAIVGTRTLMDACPFIGA